MHLDNRVDNWLQISLIQYVFSATHSGQGHFQFAVCDVAVTVNIHLSERCHQIRLLSFLLTLQDLTEVIKVQVGRSRGPVFTESGKGWISSCLLENYMR